MPPRNGPLRVEFSTAHRAKGREADYVIVLNLNDGRWGFPSKVDDDPLLELVLPPLSGGAFPFAEERRLFYVAMTRARNGDIPGDRPRASIDVRDGVADRVRQVASDRRASARVSALWKRSPTAITEPKVSGLLASKLRSPGSPLPELRCRLRTGWRAGGLVYESGLSPPSHRLSQVRSGRPTEDRRTSSVPSRPASSTPPRGHADTRRALRGGPAASSKVPRFIICCPTGQLIWHSMFPWFRRSLKAISSVLGA